METSGLLLVSVFCNMQRTPQFGDKDTIFFLISHNLQNMNIVLLILFLGFITERIYQNNMIGILHLVEGMLTT